MLTPYRFASAAMKRYKQQTEENNHAEWMRALARMEDNQELQTRYLEMIDRGVAVTNFFAAEIAYALNA